MSVPSSWWKNTNRLPAQRIRVREIGVESRLLLSSCPLPPLQIMSLQLFPVHLIQIASCLINPSVGLVCASSVPFGMELDAPDSI